MEFILGLVVFVVLIAVFPGLVRLMLGGCLLCAFMIAVGVFTFIHVCEDPMDYVYFGVLCFGTPILLGSLTVHALFFED